jgi:hypothetical protein
MVRRRKIVVSVIAVLVLILGIVAVQYAFRFVPISSPTVPIVAESGDLANRHNSKSYSADRSLVSEAETDFSRMKIGGIRFISSCVSEDGRLVFLDFVQNQGLNSPVCYVYDPTRKQFVGKFWRNWTDPNPSPPSNL